MDIERTSDQRQRIDELESAIIALTRQVGVLEDVNAIRRLQYLYGYYIDKCLYDETVELFADDGEVRFMGGIWRGQAGVKRLYCGRFRKNFTGDVNGVSFGFLLDHPQLQDVIDVAPDRTTAKVRARSLMQAGRHVSITEEGALPRQWWEGGIYENEYVREDGVWKIKVLDYNPVWHGMYDKGWSHQPANAYPFASKTYPEDPVGPDALATEPYRVLWPETSVVPFHCPHPVTGEPIVPQRAVAKAK
jgi:carotenoid cleavage dioxygenase